jgi:hypothetical protein
MPHVALAAVPKTQTISGNAIKPPVARGAHRLRALCSIPDIRERGRVAIKSQKLVECGTFHLRNLFRESEPYALIAIPFFGIGARQPPVAASMQTRLEWSTADIESTGDDAASCRGHDPVHGVISNGGNCRLWPPPSLLLLAGWNWSDAKAQAAAPVVRRLPVSRPGCRRAGAERLPQAQICEGTKDRSGLVVHVMAPMQPGELRRSFV